jgi:SAM-dependent methyltransferase
MLRELAIAPVQSVLDAGCGAGLHAIRTAIQNIIIDSVDFSEAALHDGKAGPNYPVLETELPSPMRIWSILSFGNGSYQKIFSWGAAIHIREIEKSLAELARILTQNERLALYVTSSTAAQFLHKKSKDFIFGKKKVITHSPLGEGFEFKWHDEKIWVWLIHVDALIIVMKKIGLKLLKRHSGEFSDYGLHFNGNWLSRFFWQFNCTWFNLYLPPRFAVTNLLIFEKPSGSGKGQG